MTVSDDDRRRSSAPTRPIVHATAVLDDRPLHERKPPELTAPDFLAMLLHVAAEVEHGLMVQYLYGAYSLGGAQVPAEHRPAVASWQQELLIVAKEEMGHLLTVQNLLCLLRRPANLDRSDFPYDTPYYPFPFTLEPLTAASVARYVYAEMDAHLEHAPDPQHESRTEHQWESDRQRIFDTVREGLRDGAQPHHVGALYDAIHALIADVGRIPDSSFDADSWSAQAPWDQWAKGLRSDASDHDAAATRRQALVLVEQMGSRTQALSAVAAIAGQGEAPHLRHPNVDAPSHFDRFFEIYRHVEGARGWSATPVASRPPHALLLPVNPTTTPGADGTLIESDHSRTWAHLFNVRYRILLACVAQSYRFRAPADPVHESWRAVTLHRAFAEMFNLKTLAGILFRLPLTDDPADERRAGAPFEMPYTTVLPADEMDCWRTHLDLLDGAQQLTSVLLASASPAHQRYLTTMRDLDRQTATRLAAIVHGLGGRGSRRA